MSTNAEYAAGLRQLADMIEANPGIKAHYLTSSINVWYAFDREKMQEIIRAGLAAGAQVKKEYFESTATVELQFGSIKAAALTAREQLCERVVTGTKTVQVPDPEHIPASVPLVEQVVDVVEWKCSPLLAPEVA